MNRILANLSRRLSPTGKFEIVGERTNTVLSEHFSEKEADNQMLFHFYEEQDRIMRLRLKSPQS
jgi:hypothetical protein